MITLGKQGTLHARRRAASVIRRRSVLKKLFDEIAPRFDGRAGGYTRVVTLGVRRGDAAALSILLLVVSLAITLLVLRNSRRWVHAAGDTR